MTTSAGVPAWISLLMTGFAGRALRVQAMTGGAPAPRPVLSEGHLQLPASMLGADAIDLVRAAVAHAAAHVRHSLPRQPTDKLKPMTVALVSALEDARVERLAMTEMPGLRRWWAPFHVDPPDDADLSFGGFVVRLGGVLFHAGRSSANHWVNKGRDLFEQQADADLSDREAFRRIGSVLANDLGQMRVRFEPQQYQVSPVYRDDNSFLWTHAERPEQEPPSPHELDATPQLATLTLQEVQASTQDDPQQQPQEIELGRYLLPEWNYRSGRLRRDWCTVIETVPLAPARVIAPASLLPPPPRKRASKSQLNRARRLRRQLEGDDIDLDAAIEVLVDRRLGLAPEARLFRRLGREATRVSVLVLLDLSESANDTVADSGSTVLALEQQAALHLVQAVQGRTSRVAVHGFNSNTREHVSYQRLFDFGAEFDARAAGRISLSRARHSTRMGAALRHATDVLGNDNAQWCTLLVVTDGTPSDIDVFEPRYLIEDARAAVQEARRRGVQVRCVTLDPEGEPDARRIFGWHHYRVVTNPGALAQHLHHVQSRASAA